MTKRDSSRGQPSAAMPTDLEYWKVALPAAALVAGAVCTAFGGYLIARKRGYTAASMEESKERAAFRAAQQLAIEKTQDMAFEAMAMVQKQAVQIRDLLGREIELTQLVVSLKAKNVVLEARLEHAEARLAAHEILCLPKAEDGPL